MIFDAGTGVQRIADERARQIAKEGWTPEHDDNHTEGELAIVAALYATPIRLFAKERDDLRVVRFADPWPHSWDTEWDKRLEQRDPRLTTKSRLRELEQAGALIAAEIDRLLRKIDTVGKDVP